MTAKLKDPQTFRIFFSSPFKGMEEEREELTRKYFPEIQHICAEMGLQFVPVDMRWGISTESAQKAQTVNICFREIDRSDMFVCFFGQRYGWHGHTDNLLQENIDAALSQYPWLDSTRDCSVTDLELRHGFLNNPGDIPAIVCFRDKRYDDAMKSRLKEKAVNYTCEDDASIEKLSQLRTKVQASQAQALGVHMDYPNPHEGARLIYEGILEYFTKNVQAQMSELSRREKDVAPHKAFCASHTSLYVTNCLDDFTTLNKEVDAVKIDGQDSNVDHCPHTIILGGAGSGKSALLSNWIYCHLAQRPDIIPISYFIGCEPSTLDPEELLGFVYGELDHHLTLLKAQESARPAGDAENTGNGDGSENTKQDSREPAAIKEGLEQIESEHQLADTSKTEPMKDMEKMSLDQTGQPVELILGQQLASTSNTETTKGAEETSSGVTGQPDMFLGQQAAFTINSASMKDMETTSSGVIGQSDMFLGQQAASTSNSGQPGLELLLGQQLAVVSNTDSSKDTEEKVGAGDSATANKENEKGDNSTGKGDKSTDKGSQSTKKDDGTDVESNKQKSKAEARPKGKELQHQVVKKLEMLVQHGKRVVLVFDAINRLKAASKTMKTLYWLPEKLPQGVVCVMATDETDKASIHILNDRGFKLLKMKPLNENTLKEICVQTLKHSGKELSPKQLEYIANSKETENPLFLKIVLAELSIFGSFRKLDDKILALTQVSNIKELLHSCLERLELDYNTLTFDGNLVGEVLKALCISHQGLTESEIMAIFKIPSDVWSPLYFALDFYLVSHFGKLGFAFPEIQVAVTERYLTEKEAVVKTRAKLICYFDGVRKQLAPWTASKKLNEKQVEHAVVELVWLLKKQEDKASLVNVLTDLCVMRIMNDCYELELLELWQWCGLKWSEVCTRLLASLDLAIADCYLAMEDGQISRDKSPGVRMRVATSHMRSFFDLTNHLDGQERCLKREIRMLEEAGGFMDEPLRKELLRDARYYLACTFASQDRDQEARDLHESNMVEFESALAEKDDKEVRKQIAYTYNGLGIICMHQGEYDKGIEHLIKSAEFHKNNNDKKNEASAYTNLALIYMYQQEFNKALEFNKKALEAYEEGLFGQLSMDVGNLYTNIGLVHRRMKSLNKAEEAYLKSLEIKANAVGWDHVVIATAYMNLGTLEMHRRNYAKAEQWTRKAIAVYEKNEFAVTKKEFRRCRENLFANMLKQNKHEEVLPFFLEIFDILKKNGWLEECLAGMHRQMVSYILDNKPDMLEKAEEISMALIDSPKVHPDNYCHLLVVDLEVDEDKRVVRPYKYSMDACLERFPTHSKYSVVVDLKFEHCLLPKDDVEGIVKLLKHVLTHYTDTNFEDIIKRLVDVAKEQKKEDVLYQCMKSLVEENPTNKRVLQLFIRLCISLERIPDALPHLPVFLDACRGYNPHIDPEDVKPHRTRIDVARLLVAKGDTMQARKFLLLVTAKSLNKVEKDEAKTLLDTLPEDDENDANSLVTSAA